MNIALTDLKPEWAIWHDGIARADSLETAQGILFLCPVCFMANGGPAGTHRVLCWFQDRGVPREVMPKIARWKVSGSGFSDLTLDPSVDTSIGKKLLCGARGAPTLPGWHGFIRSGRVT